MESIPLRTITSFNGLTNFSIRRLEDISEGKVINEELHRHAFYYLLYLKTGTGSHSIDFVDYKVIDNSLFFMRPNQVHQLYLKPKAKGFIMAFQSDFYSLAIDTGFKKKLLQASLFNQLDLTREGGNTINLVLEEVYQEFDTRREDYSEIIRSNLTRLFIFLIRQASVESPIIKDGSAGELVELIEEKLRGWKRVGQYANALNRSSFQLNKLSKEAFGTTVSQLIKNAILLEAKRQLLATDKQVNEIAFLLGYEDVAYFIRYFKKEVGVTPRAFRTTP